ncbi:MAG: 23S rRNA pseudouridine(1911/1915/1917) synthase RluD [Spiribacter sp.]|nr:23S rRNA pseudouridine(1911/1915/1917) synthase RluD [Spiribacter sp.]
MPQSTPDSQPSGDHTEVNARIEREAVVPDSAAGQRLDAVLATLFAEFSRSRLQRWLKDGELTVDGASPRARMAVKGGECIRLSAIRFDEGPVAAEAIDLDIVYEDSAILVVNKPAGLVVHPGAGNASGTLQNALLHHDAALAGVPRAGIVHRLDRDTTGLMVVAKTLEAHHHLVDQLQSRQVGREYLALVGGTFTAGGKVDAPIGRHPKDRLRMAVRHAPDDDTEEPAHPAGKPALTHYRIESRFAAHTLLRCKLESGRTHQIRVHMAHIRHPIVGDQLYGGRLRLPAEADAVVIQPDVSLADTLRRLHRQALHAETLTLTHPTTLETVSWSVPLPSDFAHLLEVLRAHQAHVGAQDDDDGRWRP